MRVCDPAPSLRQRPAPLPTGCRRACTSETGPRFPPFETGDELSATKPNDAFRQLAQRERALTNCIRRRTVEARAQPLPIMATAGRAPPTVIGPAAPLHAPTVHAATCPTIGRQRDLRRM